MAEGRDIVRRCLRRRQPGRYQILAAINAVHTDAATTEHTDWGEIVLLYDQLLHFDRGAVVRLNRAVAVAEVEGPAVGLAQVDRLELERYHVFHTVRADLLRRLGRDTEAKDAYESAITLTANKAEREFLLGRRRMLGADSRGIIAP
jgi:RNA polymerase sigma-70 factor, ECF subfamily